MRHPSGPSLPGHPVCGPGKIFDHQLGRCVSLMAYNRKKGVFDKGGVVSEKRYS